MYIYIYIYMYIYICIYICIYIIKMHDVSVRLRWCKQLIAGGVTQEEIIFIELMTSDQKLNASREGSK